MRINLLSAFLALLLWTASASASPTTYDFAGTFGAGGTASGSFTFDQAEPLSTDMHGLHPNAGYAVSAWNFAVVGGPGIVLPPDGTVPSTTFSDSAGTSELCLGHCVFGSTLGGELSLHNPAGFQLRLTFDLDQASLPSTVGQVRYDTPCPNCVVALFDSGTLTRTNSVPVPSTLPLFIGGLIVLAAFYWRLARSA